MKKRSLADFQNYEIRVFCTDCEYTGILRLIDGHKNIVLENTVEFRTSKNGDHIRRDLGLILLRGDRVTMTAVEGAAPQFSSKVESSLPVMKETAEASNLPFNIKPNKTDGLPFKQQVTAQSF
ncbi:hypothetical protein PCE1_004096 [Barthelona sp. PCE]